MRDSHEYRAWKHAKSRCYNPKVFGYERYGGRGIVMCERWKDSFANFIMDMGQCPEGFSINRIDNDGPYSPENCEWASASTQARNRHTSVLITHNGRTMTLIEWSEETGISYNTLMSRRKQGADLFSATLRKGRISVPME